MNMEAHVEMADEVLGMSGYLNKEDRQRHIDEADAVARKKFTTRVDTFTGKVIMERDGRYLASYPLEHKLEADKIASVMNERGIDVT